MGRRVGRDLTQGPIVKQIILFALPLIGSMLLSLFFNAADTAVLGMFCGDLTVAGAGCNGALIDLIIGLAMGISTGANVIVARYLGAKDQEGVRRSIGTSLVFGFFAGIVFLFVGFFGAETFQKWMGCDPLVLPYAVRYMKIYFLGVPIILVYNFVSSIMRANGDSFHPMLYLAIGGVVNVLLNLFFVLVLKMDVEGVAIATVASQGVALVLAFRLLIKNEGMAKIELKYLKIFKKELLEIIKIGIPCGIQGCFFSLSNVVLQRFVNSFGAPVMAAHSIAGKLDAIIYYMGNGIGLASLSYASQNLGARNMGRIKEGILKTWLIAFIGCYLVAGLCYLVKDFYLGFMTKDSAVIEACNVRLTIYLFSYPFCAVMEITTYSLRGLGYSTLSMIIMLVFCVFFRILWCYLIFPLNRQLYMLYLVWPISYLLTIISGVSAFIVAFKKLKNKIENEEKTLIKE